jgi:hypothetical protein
VSGFAPDWLRLREEADHRSRDPGLLARLALYFGARPEIRVVDLGAGLGSNLRGTYAALPPRQHWLLVDHDPSLLASAADAISDWAESVRLTTSGIEATKGGRSLHVELKRHDLVADPAPWKAEKPDLVTAAALFDLVSENWIEAFAQALSSSRVPLYAVLTHDAATDWRPAHPADAAMRSAFESHFSRDKGFGPSAGGRATALLADRLAQAGYETFRAPSPWRLGRGEHALVMAMAEGWANAVRETGMVSERTVKEWLAARAADGTRCTVGHDDLLAFPGS